MTEGTGVTAPDTVPVADRTLRTSAGEVPLHESRLAIAGREWSIVHAGAVLSHGEEAAYLGGAEGRTPYGISLWPAAIALAHDLAARADALRGRRLLELGAGTGLPGLVAASLGAHVVQTDRQPIVLTLCGRNAARNGVEGVALRVADWTRWDDAASYDWIIGADILYAVATHEVLRRIFAANLAPGGRVLLADPFRPTSLELLETMERDGWTVTMSKFIVGDDADENARDAEGNDTSPRPVGVYELAPP